MKNLLKFAAIFAFLPFFMLTSCSDDEGEDPQPEAQDRFEAFKNYMVQNDMDLSNVLDTWITSAEAVYTANTDGDDANDYFIIDIRNDADFQAGRIAGAVNSTLANVVTTAADADGHPIVVVCYTGQTAGHAVVALRLSGYPTAQVLKWGMSGWNEATAGAWQSHTGDVAEGDANWMTAPGEIEASEVHTAPTLMFETDDMATILESQVTALLEGGFNGVDNTVVLADPDSYFINNYWAETDVEHYGNIKNASRIQPLTLSNGEYAYLDGENKVVTYCWTGQTSSMITAYLVVLGYDAYSLKFGANGMIHSTLESHKYTDSEIKDYPLTSGGK